MIVEDPYNKIIANGKKQLKIARRCSVLPSAAAQLHHDTKTLVRNINTTYQSFGTLNNTATETIQIHLAGLVTLTNF